MFAVVKTGGKQYKVSQGDIIDIEKIDGEVGAGVELGPVLLTSDGNGSVEIGKPELEGKSVSARIVAQGKGEKVVILKHLKRKDSRKKQGHRQHLTTVEIISIN